jgi:predicted PurR-regulated permease PerM
MEGLVQVGVVVLIVLGIVVLALLIPVAIRLRRTVTEAERTIAELRSQALPALQELPPTINRLNRPVLDSTDTILNETRAALMPAVKEAGVTLNEQVIPSAREALVTVRHLLQVAQSLVAKIERIDRVLSVVESITHPQKVATAVKKVVTSPVSRPRVWVEALQKGYAVLRGEKPTETPSPPDGSKTAGDSSAGEQSDKREEERTMANNSDGERTVLLSVLAGIGIGAIVGAVVALLLAPKTGQETREELAKSLERLKESVAELSQRIKPALDTVASTIRQKAASGEQAVEAGEHATEQAQA